MHKSLRTRTGKRALSIGLAAFALAGPAAAAVDATTAKGSSTDLRDCAAAAAAEGLSGTWDGVKVDPIGNGSYAGGDLSVSVAGVAGNRFDWSAGAGHVQLVFVKAGPGANLYSYGAGATGDSGLVSPQPGSISHILFCTNGTAPAPPPVTPSSGGAGTTTPPPAGNTGTGAPTPGGTTLGGGEPPAQSAAGTGTGTGTAAGAGTATGTGSTTGGAGGSAALSSASGLSTSTQGQPPVQGEVSRPGVLAPPVAKKKATTRATSRKATAKKPAVTKQKVAPKRVVGKKIMRVVKAAKPNGCVRVRFATKSFPAGKPATVGLLVRNAAGPLARVSIRLRGAGIDRVVRSGRSGTAVVTLRAARAGIIAARVSGAKQCASARIGVTSGVEPTVTG